MAQQSVPPVVRQIELPGITKVSSGKVREIFKLDDRLLLVATDRISAFDVILPDPIPWKGVVLTQMSRFWFDWLAEQGLVRHHLVSTRVADFPEPLQPYREQLAGRSSLVLECRPLPVECVVRGYLAGSGWKDYKATGSVCGIRLPAGLRESEELPEPLFTPATKAVSGHDENIAFDRVVELIGADLAEQVRDLSLRIYRAARAYAAERGIIICDTKFEFGVRNGEVLLIDEVLTPDSSRFWPADQYEPGRSQPSFDKQYIRDYLETLDWDKTPPGPRLPEEVIRATTERYLEAYRLLTGRSLAWPLDE
ncbi:MAG: phosphoribosylaminoimidazolesuccinocarboxamide synthase [Acidobacteriota bacterium]